MTRLLLVPALCVLASGCTTPITSEEWRPIGIQAWPELGRVYPFAGKALRKGTDPDADFQTHYDPGVERGHTSPALGIGIAGSYPFQSDHAVGPFARWRDLMWVGAKGGGGWRVRSYTVGGQYVHRPSSRLQVSGRLGLGRMDWDGEPCFFACTPEAPVPDGHDGWTVSLGVGLDVFPFRWFGIGLQMEYLYFEASDDHDAHVYSIGVTGPIRF